MPLGFAYISQVVRSALGVSYDHDAVVTTYLATYPIFMVIVSVIAGVVFVKRVVDKWRDSVRDEIYLLGEVLHNLDEVER